jgi:hypothetical protein
MELLSPLLGNGESFLRYWEMENPFSVRFHKKKAEDGLGKVHLPKLSLMTDLGKSISQLGAGFSQIRFIF